MQNTEDLHAWCLEIISSSLFQQVAPILVLLLVPFLVLTVATKAERSSLSYRFTMGLESFGISLPWNWWSSNGISSSSGKGSNYDKKKHIRTRAEQIEMNGIAKHNGDEDDGYYPGLVNISGTYCFMNSTLQALASLSYLQPQIDATHAKAEALDVPTPVIDALQGLFHKLNTPQSSYSSIRPLDIIDVLTNHTDRRNSLLSSREHQDAQELFQLVSESIKNESAAVDKEAYRDRGLGGLSQASETNREVGKSVFDGLTANRRSCVVCGYTEAVMHFAFDNWQLAVPRLASSCRLEDCLEEYTQLEILRDCICRKCSMLATHRRLQQEIMTLEEATQPDAKPSSKKRRLKEVRRMEAKVKACLEEGRIEDDIKDLRMEKVFSSASTKQAMVARPPPVLALHINRSIHYGQYATKNNVRVFFPEVLDLTPFTTSGNLSTVPTSAISTPPPSLPRSTTPTPATYGTPITLYRLAAVVCHYGQHSFGHYICYRRKPRSRAVGKDKRWAPPKLMDPLVVEEDAGEGTAPKYTWDDDSTNGSRPGRGWLRISDDSVVECGIESVLQEGSAAFMLYYERVVLERPGIYPYRSPRGSEETLKPEMKTVQLNGSVGSLVSEVGVGVLKCEEVPSGVGIGGLGTSQALGPRIVRSVDAGRGRSASAVPSERGSSVVSMASRSAEDVVSPKRVATPTPPMNGNAHYTHTDAPPAKSGSSIPQPQEFAPTSSTAPLKSSPSKTSLHHYTKSHQAPSILSPQPSHPPPGPSVVGLKA